MSSYSSSQLSVTRERRDYLVQNRDELQLDHGWVNRRRLPYFNARSICPAGDLCKECEYIIHEMIWPLQAEEDTHYEDGSLTHGCVGWIDSMMATVNCPFCQFLVKIFFDSCPGFPRSEVVCQANRRRFCCYIRGPSCDEVTSTQPLLDQWDWTFDIHFQEVSDYDRGSGTFVPYGAPFIRGFSLDIRCKAEAITLLPRRLSKDAALTNLSRQICATWNSELFRDAFRACRTRHGAFCEGQVRALSRQEGPSSVDSQPPAALRVIDANNMSVSRLPLGKEYFALSYCWPKEGYTMLTKATFPVLTANDGLRGQDLNPTIADAISIVSLLDGRYLWVDSLCIIQDDVDDKALQLSQMDKVYRTASLTIVSAATRTDDASLGLPGVQGTPRCQIPAEIYLRGLHFRQNFPDLWNGLKYTRWDKRAWTFQEYILSKRLLVFMPDQVYFLCSRDSFAEGYIDHVCVHRRIVDYESIAPCCDRTLMIHDTDGPAPPQTRNYHNSYEDVVRTYTERQMSYSSDALKAVRGLLNLISLEHDIRFLCGLPVPHLLGYFVMWCPLGASRRRHAGLTGVNLPSWTWAGWEGAVYYAHVGYLELEEHDFQPLTSSGLHLSLESEVSEWNILVLTESGSSEINPAQMDTEALMKIENCRLSFEAELAYPDISNGLWGQPAHLSVDGQSSKSICRAILVDDTRAGALLLQQWYEQQVSGRDPLEGIQDDLAFIALSTSNLRWEMWYPYNPRWPQDDCNFCFDDEAVGTVRHPPFDKDFWDIYGHIVNVMLVQYVGDVAFRVGIGQMHVDAWNVIDRDLTRVVLG